MKRRDIGGTMVTVDATSFTSEMEHDGGTVSLWENGPREVYGPHSHSHSYRKVVCCLEGSIVFHLAAGDVELVAGDRLALDEGARHSATVGVKGCRCAEARFS